jgi:hypothetical protein
VYQKGNKIMADIYQKVERSTQSLAMKIANAGKARLKGVARQVYLDGFASLKNCEKVAQNGNQGRGFYIAKVVNAEFAEKEKENEKKKRKKGKKKQEK